MQNIVIEWKKLTDEIPPQNVGLFITNGEIIVTAEYCTWGFFPYQVDGYDCYFDFEVDTITNWALIPKIYAK